MGVVQDEPINGESFRINVEQVLVPELHEGEIPRRENGPLDRFLTLLDHGQPQQSQGPRHPSGDPRSRCQGILPPSLLTRPQPHRTGHRQTQAPAPQGRRTHQESRLAQDRLTPRPIHPAGM